MICALLLCRSYWFLLPSYIFLEFLVFLLKYIVPERIMVVVERGKAF